MLNIYKYIYIYIYKFRYYKPMAYIPMIIHIQCKTSVVLRIISKQ